MRTLENIEPIDQFNFFICRLAVGGSQIDGIRQIMVIWKIGGIRQITGIRQNSGICWYRGFWVGASHHLHIQLIKNIEKKLISYNAWGILEPINQLRVTMLARSFATTRAPRAPRTTRTEQIIASALGRLDKQQITETQTLEKLKRQRIRDAPFPYPKNVMGNWLEKIDWIETIELEKQINRSKQELKQNRVARNVLVELRDLIAKNHRVD
jgi:hypothetical protein